MKTMTNYSTIPVTYDRIHLYYGCEALGFESQGFAKPKTWRGRIGWSSLKMLEERPKDFAILPYLKPLEGLWQDEEMRDKLIGFNKNYWTVPDWYANVDKYSNLIHILRSGGYDCDNLLNRNLAILHPDYEFKHLL